MKEVPFSTLSGYTLENIYSRREVIFTTTCGKAFVLQSTIAHHWQEGDDASVLDSPVVTAEYSVIKKKYKYQTEDTHSFTITTDTDCCVFFWLGGATKFYEVTEDNDELCAKAKVLSNLPTVIVEYTDNDEVYFRVVSKSGLEFYTKQACLY